MEASGPEVTEIRPDLADGVFTITKAVTGEGTVALQVANTPLWMNTTRWAVTTMPGVIIITVLPIFASTVVLITLLEKDNNRTLCYAEHQCTEISQQIQTFTFFKIHVVLSIFLILDPLICY